ncbi:MAG: prepilin-type N-terminal cleavage/methylation domain-containing protein [Burkholderiaceae bacterium]
MRASCSEGLHCARGFTLPELVIVLVLLGVLSAVALPKMGSALAMRETAWRDQVVAALRLACSTAISHRRLVCASVASGSVQLAIAPTPGATACTAVLTAPDGSATWAAEPSGIATTISPAGTLYFQPSGRVTSDGAGASASSRTIAIAGESAITLIGETGHVR